MVLDHRNEHVDVAFGQTEPRTEVPDHRHADLGVVAGVPLADVVEQRTEHQQIGPTDTIRQLGRVRRRLPQVTIDGEAVIGVSLRARSDLLPLGQHATDQTTLVEGLDHRDRSMAFQQQRDQLVDRAGRPPLGPLRRQLGESIEAPTGRSWRRGGRRRSRSATHRSGRRPDRRRSPAPSPRRST